MDKSYSKMIKSHNMFLDCKYITQCSGCQIAHLERSSQIDFKKNYFSKLWEKTFNDIPKVEFIRPIESHFRDRVDLTVQNDRRENGHQKIGFYTKTSRDILDIVSCPLMSPKTEEFYTDLRKIHFPIQKGSLRIRISPNGTRGIWLDFSNEDIKNLLDEKTTLNSLTKICDVIEIGQKRKKLSLVNHQFKLTDPELNFWFETYDQNLKSIPLQMNVGSFSQTGIQTNKTLIDELIKILKNCPSVKNQKWLELCSGSGNLTFPLLSISSKVIATELDENSVRALKATAQKLNLQEKLQIERINIHKPSTILSALLSDVDGILADPPRSGLQGFLEVMLTIPKDKLPKNLVYVSCFAETLISDLKILIRLGFKPQKIIGIDQFPHSNHCEWIIHLNT